MTLNLIFISAWFILLMKLQPSKLLPFNLIRATLTSYLMKCIHPHQFMRRSILILLYTINYYLWLILCYLHHMLFRLKWSLTHDSICSHNKYLWFIMVITSNKRTTARLISKIPSFSKLISFYYIFSKKFTVLTLFIRNSQY